MGFDLVGRGGEYSLESAGWAALLLLAREHGWRPAGTKAPRDFRRGQHWGGNYVTNDGQRVRREDTRALAAALERALPSVPEQAPPPDELPPATGRRPPLYIHERFMLENETPSGLLAALMECDLATAKALGDPVDSGRINT